MYPQGSGIGQDKRCRKLHPTPNNVTRFLPARPGKALLRFLPIHVLRPTYSVCYRRERAIDDNYSKYI